MLFRKHYFPIFDDWPKIDFFPEYFFNNKDYYTKIYDDKTELIIRLPNINKDDIKLSVNEKDGTSFLNVEYDRYVETIDNGWTTKSSINASKSFEIPNGSDVKNIKATFRDGNLFVVVPLIKRKNEVYNIPITIRDRNDGKEIHDKKSKL